MFTPDSPAQPSRLFVRVGALLAFLGMWPAAALAATFYVATTGSDTNAGTINAPFATLARAQTAASSGDTIYIRGGTFTTFAIAATDGNYSYVHRFNKAGLNWSAYPGETVIFDFSSVPTNLRVCAFHITAAGLTVTGFNVTGVKVGAQKQSECFRIDGSGAYVDFYDCNAYNNAANGFYWTNRARGSATRCDAYNNIGTNGDAIGNTDGFGAHGNGVTFRYCRAWNNSDDGYDTISSPGANVFDHCWAYNMKAGGDSNGFKIGGYGADPATVPPSPVPVNTVRYCLAADNNAHGFYANHHPGQAATWTNNTSYNHNAGNYNMLERYSDMSADVDGYREVLHYNIAFAGTIIKSDNTPPENATDNSWTKPGVTVSAADFLSLDASQMIRPRSAGNNLPFITFMHLTPGSDLAGLGCFQPAPAAPANANAAWVNSARIDITWAAVPGATAYYVRRSSVSGGPFTAIANRLTGTSFTDDTVSVGQQYFYQVSAMDDVSYDEGATGEIAAVFPAVAVTGVSFDSGRSDLDAITTDTTLVLSGIATANSSVAVTRLGVGVIGNVTADGAGVWSYDYSGTTLAPGAHNFQVTATAPVSGGVYTSDPFTVTVDTTAPDAPVILSVGSGPMLITGTAEPLALVTVTLDGSLALAPALTGADGNWSVVREDAAANGPHSFSAVATDRAGNTSVVSATLSINTSVVMPVIVSAQSDAGALANGALTADTTLVFAGTAGAGNTVNLTRVGVGGIGATVADDSGHWSFDYTGTALPEGANTFTATGSSGTGSSSASIAFSLFVDSIAPAVTASVRQTPSAATVTSAIASLIYRVTFSEPVSGVNASDFALTSTGTAAGSVAGVSAASGTVFDVTVDALSGVGTLRLDLKGADTGIADATGNPAAAYTEGQTYSRVISVGGNGTWIETASGGLWSDADNWKDATIPGASTHSANFSTLDPTADNTVQLDAARTVNTVTFGDTDPDSAAGWILANNGVAANILTLAGTVPTITVNPLGANSLATISARIAGTGGFTKAGSGTLALTGANTLTGAFILSAGTLRIDQGGALATSTATLNAAGVRLTINGGSMTSSGLVTLGSAGSGLILSSGSASLNAGVSISSDSPTVRVEGGTFSTTTLAITRSNSSLNYANGFVFTGGTSTISSTVTLATGNSWGTMSVEGGTVTVGGAIVVGSQTTAGRGAGFRVTGGTFTATNSSGLTLSRKNASNANNVAEALFTGGTSTLERVNLGQDNTVNAGSATLTINGGTVYLGTGGIVKTGTSGLVSTVNFTNGLIGAKAQWASSHPITLPTGGDFTIKAASAANAAFNIALSGVLSGAGALTKTGAGTLTLSGVNTATGGISVDEGTLSVTGSLAAGGVLEVNVGGTLAGTGTIAKAITLNSDGILSPADTAAGTLTGDTLTWNGGGKIAADLGAGSDRLMLAGALTKGSAGAYRFVFTGSPAVGTAHTVASFASTTFAASDFSFSGLSAAVSGRFSISNGSLVFTVTDPADAAFNTWAAALPADQRAPTADPDGDGIANLLEFALGHDGALATARRESNGIVTVAGQDYPTLTYTRRIDRGGVDVAVLVSASLDFNASLGSVEVSATAAGLGLETVIVRSAIPLSTHPRQFFRLTASLP